jgi:hypothetical protein
MGLNLSNHPIAQELDLNQDDVLRMTMQLQSGIVAHKPAACLTGGQSAYGPTFQETKGLCVSPV